MHAEASDEPKSAGVVDDLEKGNGGDAAEANGNEAATEVPRTDSLESDEKTTGKSTSSPQESKDGNTD